MALEYRPRPTQDSEPKINSHQFEHFKGVNPIKDIVQNSLDAKDPELSDKPVVIRIFDSNGTFDLPVEKAKFYTEGIIPHLKSGDSGLNSLPSFSHPMRYLVIEDFNTVGLEGEPNEFDVMTDDKGRAIDGNPHNFYNFWNSLGMSLKSDGQLGSYGLGKSVLWGLSRINTVFGLTVRKSDGQTFSKGLTILRNHHVNNQPYGPYCYYGNFIANDDYCSYAIDDEDWNNSFRTDFNLSRKDEAGLSCVIFHPKKEYSQDFLLSGFISAYFATILRGKVELHYQSGEEEIIVNKDSVWNIIDRISQQFLDPNGRTVVFDHDKLKATMKFAVENFTKNETDFINLDPEGIKNKPRWNKKSLFPNEKKMKSVREQFIAGKIVSFKVPVPIGLLGEEPKMNFFSIFFKKNADLRMSSHQFIRSGMAVLDKAKWKGGMSSMIIVEESPKLERFIADAENPAHTEIGSNFGNFKNKYVDGDETLNFILKAHNEILTQLMPEDVNMYTNILSELLPFKDKEDENKTNTGSERGDCESDSTKKKEFPKDEIDFKTQPLIFSKTNGGGIIISLNEEYSFPNETYKITFGYDTIEGNPLTKWEKRDFTFSKTETGKFTKLNVKGVNTYFDTLKDNIMVFKPEKKKNFFIEIRGFDENREVYIETKKV